ncbi:MAG: autotransporter-associated beta strand repeat-containing protein, partial [Akkermansiaceae bacterium]|nr:autotransporter-associated beta strand repeat-containing protein [Akkermansiaceae bacterium]
VNLNGGVLASNNSNPRAISNNLAVGSNLTLGQATGGTGNLTLSGTMNLGAATRTITVDNAATFLTGAISNGGITKAGSGALTLSGVNTYTGATTISSGNLVVNGSISTSILTTVSSAATIGGSGTVGALTVLSGGFVTPGNSPGILTVNGNYTQAGTYTAEITATTPGVSGYDQIDVTGAVNITGGSLIAQFNTFTPVNGNLLFILLNDGSDSITGTFSGYAQGDIISNYGGIDWKISYTADSTSNTFTGGNDIAIMAVPEPNIAVLLGGLGAFLLCRRRA